MASSGTPSRRTRIFRCRPPPTSQQDTTAAERSSSTGLGLPDPKGSSSASPSTWTVLSRAQSSTSASTSMADSMGESPVYWDTSRRIRSWKAGIFSSRMVKPAAISWPP